MRGSICAFAICLQFQVGKYCIRWWATVAICNASTCALGGRIARVMISLAIRIISGALGNRGIPANPSHDGMRPHLARQEAKGSQIRVTADRFLSPIALISADEHRLGTQGGFQSIGCFSWPFRMGDYLDLLDWTARQVAPGERGMTPT